MLSCFGDTAHRFHRTVTLVSCFLMICAEADVQIYSNIPLPRRQVKCGRSKRGHDSGFIKVLFILLMTLLCEGLAPACSSGNSFLNEYRSNP